MEHHFKLEFVDSGLYFVKDENNFIYPLLQVESGSDEKSNGSGRPQIDGLTIIPAYHYDILFQNRKKRHFFVILNPCVDFYISDVVSDSGKIFGN